MEEKIKALALEKEVGSTAIFNSFNSEKAKRESVNWDLLRKVWLGALYINPGIDYLDWREEVLTITDLEESLASNSEELYLEGRKTDSYTIQAQRRGCFPNSGDALQTTVVGIVESCNGDEILLGKRAGSEGVGQVIPVPAGAVPYPPSHRNNYDYLTPALLSEAVEEVGILSEEIADLRLVGVYRQELGSATPSNVFLYFLKLAGTTANLRERHRQAFEYYKSSKRKSLGDIIEQEIYARKALQQRAAQVRGSPADVWEHSQLFSFTTNPETILKELGALLEVEKVKPIFYGALALYILHRWGRGQYAKILNLPQFKEQVREGYIEGHK